MTRFEPHGNPRTTLRDRIVEVRPDGPGNLEAVRSLLAEMAQMIARSDLQPWAVLLVSEAQTLLTPDAESALAEAMPQLRAIGHVATAVALENTALRDILDRQFRRIHARSGVAFAVFPSVADAERWLRGVLADRDLHPPQP